MMATRTTASRLLICARAKPAVAQQLAKVFLSTSPPKEAFNLDGHLITDHLEYLDEMIEKSIKMERSVTSLQNVYAQKKRSFHGGSVKWMDNPEIQQLFQEADMRKEELETTLKELRSLSEKVKKHLPFAVDSPDGQVDGQLDEEIVEINKIIDSAAEHEDKEAIEYSHKMDDAVRKDRIRDPEHDW